MNMNQFQIFPERNISRHLLKHQQEMLRFLYFTQYDIILQSFQLKHASYISSTKRGYPVQQFNKSEQIQRHFGIISQKLHMRFMRQDMALDRMLQNLQVFWLNKSVPIFHRYYFEKYIHSAHIKGVVELMEMQYKLVKQQKHHFYLITKTVKAREACLRQLKKQTAELTVQDFEQYFHFGREKWVNEKKKNEHYSLQQKGYILKNTAKNNQLNFQQTAGLKCKLEYLSDTFGHLTKLTLYCIDQILNWKYYIYSLTHDVKKKRQRLEYFYFQENYLLKILSDTTFLNVSLLAQYLKFAPKNDPFQLYPIINIQNSSTKNLHYELLKQIFMPFPQQLPQIFNKIQLLSVEYKWNIKSRKNYDLNILKIPSLLKAQNLEISAVRTPNVNKKSLPNKQIKNIPNTQHNSPETISNIMLKKILDSSKRTNSLKTFRVRSQTKNRNIFESSSKDKILVESKISPKKKTNWLPGITLKTVKQTQISPLKNSVILEKNTIYPLAHNEVSDDLLKSLKQQVIRKIKQDFNTNAENKSNDQALEMYINSKINEAIKGIFPYEPEKKLKPPIQLTAIRIHEQNLNQQISLIVRHSLEIFKDMQLKENEIVKQISQAPFAYFLKATEGQNHIGTLIFTLEKDMKQYKTLRALFIGFIEINHLEMLIIQSTKFLEKYQNAFQVHFPFLLPLNNQPVDQLLSKLQKSLTKSENNQNLNCGVAQRQIFSNLSETRFMFKRQEENVGFYPNTYPSSLHFKLSLIHSEKKLFLERSKFENEYEKKVSYDKLLAEILGKKQMCNEKFKLLKQKVLSQVRFNQLLRKLSIFDEFSIENNKFEKTQNKNEIRYVETSSISELNKTQAKNKQSYPYMELSDTVKTGNSIQYASMQKVYELPYSEIKAVLGDKNQTLYRITVNQEIPVQVYKDTFFYQLGLQEGQPKGFPGTQTQKIVTQSSQKNPNNQFFNDMKLKLVLFSAQQFLRTEKSDLTSYLIQALVNNNEQKRKKFVSHLWIPMLRYPQNYSKKQELFMTTHPLNDMKETKTHFYLGEFIEWFCHLSIPNSIIYSLPKTQHRKGQLNFRKPFGIAIISYHLQKATLQYARVFSDE